MYVGWPIKHDLTVMCFVNIILIFSTIYFTFIILLRVIVKMKVSISYLRFNACILNVKVPMSENETLHF